MVCVQMLLFSHSVMSDSLQPHELKHARLPCPLPTPGAYSNSCPLSRWSHPTISSSVIPFSCLQSFPESGSFPVSQFFTSGGQSIGASALASVLPMNIQVWFLLELTGWISLQSKGLSRVFTNTTVQKHQFFGTQFSLSDQISRSVVSDSLQPHESQHARPPCPSPTPGVHPDSCPSSQWCHLALSSSVVPFSSCPQSLPASGSFQMSQFLSGSQSIGVSASASVLPMNIQDWFPLGWTGWILQSKGLSTVFSNTTVRKHQFFSAQLSL